MISIIIDKLDLIILHSFDFSITLHYINIPIHDKFSLNLCYSVSHSLFLKSFYTIWPWKKQQAGGVGASGPHLSYLFLHFFTLSGIFLSEARPRCLGRSVCQSVAGCPEHPLHPTALPVHADVWSPHQRKHSHPATSAWVSMIKWWRSENWPVAFARAARASPAGPWSSQWRSVLLQVCRGQKHLEYPQTVPLGTCLADHSCPGQGMTSAKQHMDIKFDGWRAFVMAGSEQCWWLHSWCALVRLQHCE